MKYFAGLLLALMGLMLPATADPVFAPNVPPAHVTAYLRAWNTFPPPTRQGTVYVEYAPTERGGYNPNTNTIKLPQGAPVWRFAHEYGHYCYFKLLAGEDQQEWDTFWLQHRSWMPTAYGRLDRFEGYAESFRYLVMQGPLMPATRAELFLGWSMN